MSYVEVSKMVGIVACVLIFSFGGLQFTRKPPRKYTGSLPWHLERH